MQRRQVVFSYNGHWYVVDLDTRKVYIVEGRPKLEGEGERLIENQKLNLRLTSLSIYDFDDEEIVSYISEESN